MSARLHRRILMASSLALALPLVAFPAGCGGKPAETDTAEVVTQTAPAETSPAPVPAPAADPGATPPVQPDPTPTPAESKPQG